jgi:hypothetical protein
MVPPFPELLWKGGYHARFLPSGHLVYIYQDTLFAVAFDLASLRIMGQPSAVLEDVHTNRFGGAHFDCSAEGSLVYVTGSVSKRRYELTWVDREGKRELLLPADRYRSFRLSPDGRFLAYSLDDGVQSDIWIYDIQRGVPTKLTFDPAKDMQPIWSPSGQSVVFASERHEGLKLFWKRADGSGEAVPLTDNPGFQWPWAWHPDGRHLIIGDYRLDDPVLGTNLCLVTLSGDDRSGWQAEETTDYLATRFNEWSASFSPDGRWLAYASDESGQYHVFVHSFPEGDGKKQISVVGIGAAWPLWSSPHQELTFFTKETPEPGEGQIYTSMFRTEAGAFMADRPVRWEDTQVAPPGNKNTYDLHPDGERLLVKSLADVNDTKQVFDHVVLFENFFDYLREKVPVE